MLAKSDPKVTVISYIFSTAEKCYFNISIGRERFRVSYKDQVIITKAYGDFYFIAETQDLYKLSLVSGIL